ncbi:MAG: hypothetical protein GY928_38100 [Colwellia sp.]|nr:hypothetical protein [Colwellia sp.]
MKSVIVVLICFFVMACSSTKVHLYARYLSAQETEKVTKNIKKLGFDVVANSLNFPDEIEQSTLIYSPFIEGENRVDILLESLSEVGWNISSVKPIFSGNHYYTKNSAALLLLPDGALQSDKVSKQDIANEYKSTTCELSMILRLNSDATYQFLYSNKMPIQTEQLTGTWQVTSYPYIELVSSNKFRRFYYEVQKSTRTDVVGKIDVIELKPIDDHYKLPKCSFAYGVRK